MPDEGNGNLTTELLADVLAPYKEHCRYVTGGVVSREEESGAVVLAAELSIGASCYLDDEEPFQPPELNICYNQLLYLVLAHGVEYGLFPELASWDYAEFKRRQLPDVLILDFQCEFGEPPVRRDAFRGSITVDRVTAKRRLTLLRTRCSFHDDLGARAAGRVIIGIVNTADCS